MICEDGTVRTSGERCGSTSSEYTVRKIGKDDKVKPKIIKVSASPKTVWVLTDENKAYFKGCSRDFSLPEDREESEFKEFKLSSDISFSDKIVDLAAGRHFHCFVTESGKLYA